MTKPIKLGKIDRIESEFDKFCSFQFLSKNWSKPIDVEPKLKNLDLGKPLPFYPKFHLSLRIISSSFSFLFFCVYFFFFTELVFWYIFTFHLSPFHQQVTAFIWIFTMSKPIIKIRFVDTFTSFEICFFFPFGFN